MDVTLRVINQSNDANNSQIVIFQKNTATNADKMAHAWEVINFSSKGDEHSFTFPLVYEQIYDKDKVMPKGVGDEGGLPAKASRVAPHKQEAFESLPTIWIGAVSDIEEGEILNSAMLASINTEISLFGIKSADIIMTGGGPGDTPISFALENVVKA